MIEAVFAASSPAHGVLRYCHDVASLPGDQRSPASVRCSHATRPSPRFFCPVENMNRTVLFGFVGLAIAAGLTTAALALGKAHGSAGLDDSVSLPTGTPVDDLRPFLPASGRRSSRRASLRPSVCFAKRQVFASTQGRAAKEAQRVSSQASRSRRGPHFGVLACPSSEFPSAQLPIYDYSPRRARRASAGSADPGTAPVTCSSARCSPRTSEVAARSGRDRDAARHGPSRSDWTRRRARTPVPRRRRIVRCRRRDRASAARGQAAGSTVACSVPRRVGGRTRAQYAASATAPPNALDSASRGAAPC